MEIGPTRTLNSQVGGHAGVLTTEDGSLLIKAALPPELGIYQKLLYDPAFEALRPFTADFLGTLKLEGEVDQSNPITANGGIAIKPTNDHKVHRLRECYIPLLQIKDSRRKARYDTVWSNSGRRLQEIWLHLRLASG